MNKYKIIAIFGPSCAGKDTIAKALCKNKKFNAIISCTTRPKRDYEKDGIDYHFLTDEEFTQKVLDKTMLEAVSFRKWFYGTPLESLRIDKINIGVFNIEGIETLIDDPRLQVYPIEIYATDKVRLQRALAREVLPDCDEICRRFLADKKDFDKELSFPVAQSYSNSRKEDKNWAVKQITKFALSKLD